MTDQTVEQLQKERNASIEDNGLTKDEYITHLKLQRNEARELAKRFMLERNRLVDGIREHREYVLREVGGDEEAQTEGDLRLWSLLDGSLLALATDDKDPWRNNGCPHGFGFDDCCHDPSECVATDDPPVPYRALEGSEGGEDGR